MPKCTVLFFGAIVCVSAGHACTDLLGCDLKTHLPLSSSQYAVKKACFKSLLSNVYKENKG